ncbi:MAG TPA: hypothetical protein VMI75_34490 [Polyangiaceae bacterium]|nr:hypothetical protein [Polyangiaceae bacterium]
MVAKAAVTRIPNKVHTRYGQDRDPLVRTPFGLGQSPSPGAAERCLKCGFGNVPVIEEVVWTCLLPLSHNAVQRTFGDIVSLTAGGGTPEGVCSVDSTFAINCILQTDLFCTGIGVHVFVEPHIFTAIGNGWTAPATPTSPPPSPDVWTENDAVNGALGGLVPVSGQFPLTPASLSWGGDAWEAGWNFMNAYQLQFRTNQRELMINEMLSDVAYFASFGDAVAAGTSECAVIEYAALANAQYRALGSGVIFLPANFRRYGGVGTTASTSLGLFHPTRDFDFAPQTWGGIKFQGTACRGQMYRQVEKPCFFERGIPIDMKFIAVDACHQARFQAALAIDSFTGSQNLQPDVNVSGYTLTATTGPYEQSLDLTTPTNIPQATTVERQVFKGGIFKVAVKLKGWEMPGAWKAWCQKNLPQILAGSSAATPASSMVPAQ